MARNHGTEAGSVLLFGIAVFALIALVSYQPGDPSWFTQTTVTARNACGKMGAYLASLFIECFGIASFLVPAALGFMSSVVYKREGSVRLFGTMGGMAVCVMALTVFLTLQWKFWPFAGTLILTGGAFGAWMETFLRAEFNQVGSSIVSLMVFCLALALSTPISVARAGAFFARTVGLFTWRVTKLVGTYFAYLAGLAAMRTAHSAGDYLQRLIETAIKRAKSQAESKARARENEIAAEKAQKLLPDLDGGDEEEASVYDGKAAKAGKKPAKTAELLVAPEIGNGTKIKSKAKTKELEIGQIGDRDDSDEEEEIEGLEAAGTSGVPELGEAPNALPELEKKKPAAVVQSKAPQILPHEPSGPGAGAMSAGLPMMSKDGKQMAMDVRTPEEVAEADKAALEAAAKAEAKLEKERSRRSKKGQWKLPPIDFLRKVPKVEGAIDREKLIANSRILTQKFLDFGIEGEVTAVRPGPVITLYEFRPGPGVKVSRIAALADDLSMALSAQSVRILAPLPGKAVVGIEIPSDVRETVYMREFLQNSDFHGPKHAIPIIMGKDIAGQTFLADMAKMPHLLSAGQTGSGKSVFMNGLICSLLYRFTPDEMRMILVDPKFIEFRAYQDIPHLLLPVVDDPKHAATALKWAVREMERRYRILAFMGARNLASYNQKVDEMGADVVRDLLTSEENQPEGIEKMSGGDWIEAFEQGDDGHPMIGKLPYIVIIIDELADLMMIAKKEVEISIARIAQKARAAGIHLVIATQRPSTDVVTGLIKANLPSRVSFQLASYIDSKTILDRPGAERLLGQGDMLFIAPGTSNLLRLHGAYVDDDEIGKVTSFLKSQGKPAYKDEILVDDEAEGEEGGGGGEDDDDELMQEAVELVKRSGHASASFLQRHLKVGYNRAARMIETMELRGVVGPADGARPREVLIR